MDSLQGKFLIASGRLADPNFARTVILLVRHDEDGALGLILNRPLEVSVADAVGSDVEAASEVNQMLHQGGPCEGPLMVLHTSLAAGGEQVVDGVRFTAQREEIESVMADNQGPTKYFANYSGWGAGQLEAELEQGGWLLAPAKADEVFAEGDNAFWSKLSARVTLSQWIDPDSIPDDPSMN